MAFNSGSWEVRPFSVRMSKDFGMRDNIKFVFVVASCAL